MTTLKMTFDCSQDFTRACEHFENNSKYQPEVDNENMHLTFECKQMSGAEKRKQQIEDEIFYLPFEYDTFVIL